MITQDVVAREYIHIVWFMCYVMYIVNYTRNFCHHTSIVK